MHARRYALRLLCGPALLLALALTGPAACGDDEPAPGGQNTCQPGDLACPCAGDEDCPTSQLCVISGGSGVCVPRATDPDTGLPGGDVIEDTTPPTDVTPGLDVPPPPRDVAADAGPLPDLPSDTVPGVDAAQDTTPDVAPDAASDAATDTGPPPPLPTGDYEGWVAFNADVDGVTTEIWFRRSSGQGDILRLNTTFPIPNITPLGAAWFADGSGLAWVGWNSDPLNPGEIIPTRCAWTVNFASGNQRPYCLDRAVAAVDVAPTGDHLIALAGTVGSRSLWRIRLSDGQATEIYSARPVTYLRYARNGERIFFSSGGSLYSIAPDGSGENIESLSAPIVGDVFTVGASLRDFAYQCDGGLCVVVGGGASTVGQAQDGTPEFSASSAVLVLRRILTSEPALVRMAPNGTSAETIVPARRNVNFNRPRFSPQVWSTIDLTGVTSVVAD